MNNDKRKSSIYHIVFQFKPHIGKYNEDRIENLVGCNFEINHILMSR